MPFQNYFSQFQSSQTINRIKKARKARNPRLLGYLLPGLMVLILLSMAAYYYIVLPPINWQSSDFWVFLTLMALAIWLIATLIRFNRVLKRKDGGRSWPSLASLIKWPSYILSTFVAFLAFAVIYAHPVFHTKQYANLIQIEKSSFTKDIKEADVNQIPILDRDSAQRIGSRKVGEVGELVSQFEPDNAAYTQINLADRPVRIAPLQYVDFYKWLTNHRQGIPFYIKVDMVTGKAKLVKTAQPIRYSNAEYFNRNVKRKLRFDFPTKIFRTPSFEISEDGTPYYIASTYKNHFLLSTPEAEGVVLLNALTGKTKYYAIKDAPKWIDRIHSAAIIMDQLDYHGRYQGGYWNSLFGKRGVTQTTEGYNYLAIDDDIYLYTGITSASSDASNVGFALVNMRTKQARFYDCPGAEETSAMQSAEGSVQEKQYKATFPILINLANRSTYLMALKDQAGLVKMYALVDAQDYQQVITGHSVKEVIDEYSGRTSGEGQQASHQRHQQKGKEEVSESLTGQLEEVQQVVVDGNTMVYVKIKQKVYHLSLDLDDAVAFLKAGDIVTLGLSQTGSVQTFEKEEAIFNANSAHPNQQADKLTEPEDKDD